MSSHSCTQSQIHDRELSIRHSTGPAESLKPGTHTRQSSKGSCNQGSHSDPNMGNSKEDHEEMAFLYGSWPVLERAAVDVQSSQEECLQGDLWRRAPTIALCVDAPEGHTWKAHSPFPPLLLLQHNHVSYIYGMVSCLSYSLFSFLTMTFIDRGHSECSGHILCSSRLSLKIRAQFNFMRLNEIHFSGCCPWPDTGRNIKLVSQGYTGIELSSLAILPLTNLMVHFSVI